MISMYIYFEYWSNIFILGTPSYTCSCIPTDSRTDPGEAETNSDSVVPTQRWRKKSKMPLDNDDTHSIFVNGFMPSVANVAHLRSQGLDRAMQNGSCVCCDQ